MEGDVVALTARDGDWWSGRNARTGQSGTFPATYVGDAPPPLAPRPTTASADAPPKLRARPVVAARAPRLASMRIASSRQCVWKKAPFLDVMLDPYATEGRQRLPSTGMAGLAASIDFVTSAIHKVRVHFFCSFLLFDLSVCSSSLFFPFLSPSLYISIAILFFVCSCILLLGPHVLA